MDRRINNDRRDSAGAILPPNATAAIQRLIQVSQKLVHFSERETQALLLRDMTAFAILQDEKETLAAQYTAASEEFRTRLDNFRSVEKSLLLRLEGLQKTLSEKAHSNNLMVFQMQKRSESQTQKTLLMAQEYGQQKRSRFSQNDNNKQRGVE